MSATLLHYCRPLFKELKHLLIIAGPILIAQLAQTAMGFVDTVMAGRLSAESLAAVAIGSGIWLPIFLAVGGILMALTPVVAKLSRQNRSFEIVRFFHQTLWLALLFSLLCWLVIRHCEWLLILLRVPEQIQTTVNSYLLAVSWALPASALYQACRALHEGLAKTHISMLIGLIGLAINVPANYVFIYGKLGLPAMGAIGCAWGTTFVFWFMALSICIVTVFMSRRHELQLMLQRCRFSLIMTVKLLKIGLPIGGTIFIEVTIFCIIALLVAPLGTQVVAAQQIALNLSGLFFMIPLSLSMAMTIQIGQALGHQQIQLARLRCITGLLFIGLVMLLSMATLLLFKGSLSELYTRDNDVATLASHLLFYAAIFQISDGLQIGAAGALRGYQDTGFTLSVMIFTFWGLALPFGYYLTYYTQYGPEGFWLGLLVGLSLTALMLLIRVKSVSSSPKLTV